MIQLDSLGAIDERPFSELFSGKTTQNAKHLLAFRSTKTNPLASPLAIRYAILALTLTSSTAIIQGCFIKGQTS